MNAPIGAPPGLLPSLDDQGRMARRARVTGRRWILRGILFFVVSVVGFARGGPLMNTIGIVCLILAVLSVSLGRQTRRQAMDIEKKIRIMRGEAGGGAVPREPGARA